jgi:hypothetical protein
LIKLRETFTGNDHAFTLQARLYYVTQALVPQQRFPEAARLLAQTATTLGPSQPESRAAFEHTLSATLDAWKALGGGPEFDEFQRQANANLARPRPR